MIFQESSVSALGGMARVTSNSDFFGCPPWVAQDKWNNYRTSYTEASKGNSSFIQLDLELADNCNYKCIECPISDDLTTRSIHYLDKDKALVALLSARKAGAVALKLNYINEPLLDLEKLIDIAQVASDIGFIDIYFTTNGSMLSEETSRKLISSKLFSRIQVSLDALNPDTYSRIRRGGNLDKVKSNIFQYLDIRALLDTSWPKLRVSFLSLPENKDEEIDFFNFWINVVDAVAVQSSVLKPNSKRKDLKYFQGQRSSFCPNPFRQLVLRANGSILPCCSFWGEQLVLGTFEEASSLESALNSDIMKDIRDSFTCSDHPLRSACVSCLSSCDPSAL